MTSSFSSQQTGSNVKMNFTRKKHKSSLALLLWYVSRYLVLLFTLFTLWIVFFRSGSKRNILPRGKMFILFVYLHCFRFCTLCGKYAGGGREPTMHFVVAIYIYLFIYLFIQLQYILCYVKSFFYYHYYYIYISKVYSLVIMPLHPWWGAYSSKYLIYW